MSDLERPLLEVRGLEVHFPITRGLVLERRVGEVRAVDGVDLEIRRGETLGLVGESGCGKTTFGRAVTRLTDATAGSITFDGQDVTHLGGERLRALRRRMQLIFQDPFSSLDPRQSVASIVGEPLRAHGLASGARADRRVRELLEVVGLPAGVGHRYPDEFSGGQRQRIGIARALAVDPDLIVADEPVSALDMSIQAQVVNLLEELQERLGLTYLFIAHDLAVVRHISDRVAVMYVGRIMEVAPSDALPAAAAPLHHRPAVGHPHPRPGGGGPAGAHPAPGRPALAGPPAARLPVPHPVPVPPAHPLPRRDAGPPRAGGRPHGGLPLGRGGAGRYDRAPRAGSGGRWIGRRARSETRGPVIASTRNAAADHAQSHLSDRSIRRLTPHELLRALVVGAVFNRRVLPGLLRKRTRTAEAIAPRVHHMVVDLGPPFMKLSQLVASSPGLFPAPISEELRVLLDAAPPEPWDDIRKVVEESLGAPIGTLFASVEPEALAAASIAQVHGATLHDGTRVVIKVRRPGVDTRFRTDLRLLRVIARLAARFSKYARVLNPVAIVDGVVQTLREELDFVREADSMERFSRNLRAFGSNDSIYVPLVHRELTCSTVLTMERVDGIKVDDLLNLQLTGLDLTDLLKKGVRAWIEAAMEHRFFHGDVHAGNLMLDGHGRVVFLDFGIMGELDETTRDLIKRGVVALLFHRDFREVTECLTELGAHLGAEHVDQEQAAAAIGRLALPVLDKPISEIDYRDLFTRAVRGAARHGVQLPRSLVLLTKQILYFERYAKLVAPDYDILADTFLIEFMIDDIDQGAAQDSA